ncbi:L-type lectin-domain containing receptor kinase IX.1 [Acorus calamus]|uniref:non-specific serine/threonine protein kinase n=1 Tax=Acorus calamus TaxID=4465 RepID=A0AAV9DG66_ACOCL|nr:L-type lectin-domain containing receptor kinase IX.1 [Acorus calamus]
MASSNISTYTLISSLFFFHLLISSANSTHFDFSSFDPNNKAIIYYGDATADSRGFIDLTRNNGTAVGRAIYNQSIPLWNPITRQLFDFTTQFNFTISKTVEKSGKHGIVFFLSPNGSFIPDDAHSCGGCLGMVSLNGTDNSTPPFVGVEFDTYNNNWDPSDFPNHIGIDINRSVKSVVTNGTTYLFNGGDLLKAWVVYNGTQRRLSVNLTFGFNGSVSGALTLSHDVDFRDVFFDSPYVYVGFSATTDESFEYHQIDSWAFDSTDFNQTITHHRNVGVIAGVVGATVVLGVLLLWLVREMKSRRNNRDDYDDDDDIDLGDDERGPQRFPYGKLAAATDDFNEDRKLGTGGFGGVYRGFLEDTGLEVAIKKVSDTSKQGKKEYLSEVKIISQLRHRHLVQLIGYCRSNSRFLIVYELVPNGSLDSYLFGSKGCLPWPVRHRIALGLASALLYLHEEWTRCVLHRDVKASNVMLDENFEAKLGDFGLARLVDHDQNQLTTDVAGTRGYLAPECYYTRKASRESDVYSFGVVALEIACGRKVLDFTVGEERLDLVKWVWELYGLGRVREAADWRLGGEFDEGEMERLVGVGLWCAHPNHASRPSMRQAIGVLCSEAELPELPCSMPMPFAVPIDRSELSFATYSYSAVSAR